MQLGNGMVVTTMSNPVNARDWGQAQNPGVTCIKVGRTRNLFNSNPPHPRTLAQRFVSIAQVLAGFRDFSTGYKSLA